jgi:riboflavin synthase
MFTGLIQELGEVKALSKRGSELRLIIDLKSLAAQNLQIGESISINGACHTLEELKDRLGTFFSSNETINKTNFGSLKTGDKVNLELSLTPSTRMGGHFVSGHIDGIAKLLSVANQGESYLLHFEVSSQFGRYLVSKGSVCLNGISLTVANCQNNLFSVAVIPHTWTVTNLQFLRPGTLLNFEADLLAKYLEKMLSKD